MRRVLSRLGLMLGVCCSAVCPARPLAQSPPKAVALQSLAFAQWQQKLAGYRGQIVVVDFWATWCGPCMERFPHMVSLYRRYGQEGGIRFVSMDLDDRDDPRGPGRALEFLRRQGADFKNYRMDEVIPDAFDKLDLVGIPAVMIYDRTGKLRYRLTGDDPNRQFTDANVEDAIKTLLAARR